MTFIEALKTGSMSTVPHSSLQHREGFCSLHREDAGGEIFFCTLHSNSVSQGLDMLILIYIALEAEKAVSISKKRVQIISTLTLHRALLHIGSIAYQFQPQPFEDATDNVSSYWHLFCFIHRTTHSYKEPHGQSFRWSKGLNHRWPA